MLTQPYIFQGNELSIALKKIYFNEVQVVPELLEIDFVTSHLITVVGRWWSVMSQG